MLYRHHYGVDKDKISRSALLLVACLFAVVAVIVPAGAQGKSQDQADSAYSISGHHKGKSELLHVNPAHSE